MNKIIGNTGFNYKTELSGKGSKHYVLTKEGSDTKIDLLVTGKVYSVIVNNLESETYYKTDKKGFVNIISYYDNGTGELPECIYCRQKKKVKSLCD